MTSLPRDLNGRTGTLNDICDDPGAVFCSRSQPERIAIELITMVTDPCNGPSAIDY